MYGLIRHESLKCRVTGALPSFDNFTCNVTGVPRTTSLAEEETLRRTRFAPIIVLDGEVVGALHPRVSTTSPSTVRRIRFTVPPCEVQKEYVKACAGAPPPHTACLHSSCLVHP